MEWFPFSSVNLTSPFWGVNGEILIFALLAVGILLLFVTFSAQFLKKENESSSFTGIIRWGGDALYDLIYDAIGFVDKRIFVFIGGLFFLILFYNWICLVPYCEEPTKDLNVTAALGVYAFFTVHRLALFFSGASYWSHWFKTPLSLNRNLFFLKQRSFFSFLEYVLRLLLNCCIACCLFPFEFLSRISLLISLSFRLFGNVFGGSMVGALVNGFFNTWWVYQLIGMATGVSFLVLLFFGFFEGAIQAFVFSIVALNNIGILSEGKEKRGEEERDEEVL